MCYVGVRAERGRAGTGDGEARRVTGGGTYLDMYSCMYQLLQQYLYLKWWRAQRAEEKMVSLKVDTRK